MVRLENLTKVFYERGRHKLVVDNICATFPTGTAVGLLGRNGAGKSTLLRMIAGTIEPSSGQIVSDGTISWPVGFAGSSHPDLTGLQNVRFIARVYGIDTDTLVEFVEDFAELGGHFHLPVRTYSSGMRARLAFGLSMGIDFETYLVDEVTSVGDASFRAKSEAVFQQRMRQSGAILVSHGMGMLRRNCQAGAVLENGHLSYFDDIEEAIAAHEENIGAAGLDED